MRAVTAARKCTMALLSLSWGDEAIRAVCLLIDERVSFLAADVSPPLLLLLHILCLFPPLRT